MIESLRIAVADDDDEMCSYYQRTLTARGHHVTSVSPDGNALVLACRNNRPDLIVSDIHMPQLDGIAAVTEICREEPLPVILVSAHDDDKLLKRASLEYILAYLVKPIKRTDLEMAITLVMQRFRQFQSLRQQANDLLQALEDRKIIERAKGIVMKRTTLDEPAAFRRLQKIASEKNLKLVAIAQQIVTAEQAFA